MYVSSFGIFQMQILYGQQQTSLWLKEEIYPLATATKPDNITKLA